MDLHEVEKVTVNAAGGTDTININDGDHLTVVDNGNGNLTISGVSGATVHITGFEAANDHLLIDGNLFGF